MIRAILPNYVTRYKSRSVHSYFRRCYQSIEAEEFLQTVLMHSLLHNNNESK